MITVAVLVLSAVMAMVLLPVAHWGAVPLYRRARAALGFAVEVHCDRPGCPASFHARGFSRAGVEELARGAGFWVARYGTVALCPAHDAGRR